MLQSSLPEDLERVTVSSMLDGETGYVVPWAILADDDRRMWIRGDHEFTPEPRGTSHVKITRRGDTICVERATIGDHRYDSRESIPAEWNPMPVVLE